MGLPLSTDLVADVMRYSDPARLERTMAKLRRPEAGESTDTAFSGLLGDVQGKVRIMAPSDAYVGFEQMVLRNLFESLLPAAQSGAFGAGPGAGIWRSMAADQLASLYADTGGAGIARMLTSTKAGGEVAETSHWPYFSVSQIEAFSG